MKSSAVNARMSETVRRDAEAGGDVRHGARQRDPVEALEPPEPEGAAGVDRERVDVADAVDRLHRGAARTRRTRRGRSRSAASCPSVRKSSGMSDGRRDRAQELDRHAERTQRELARAEEDPERHGEHRRDRRARAPSRARCSRTFFQKWLVWVERPELVEGRARRRQVGLRDDAGPRDELPDDERGNHGHDRQRHVADTPRPAYGCTADAVHAARRAHDLARGRHGAMYTTSAAAIAHGRRSGGRVGFCIQMPRPSPTWS